MNLNRMRFHVVFLCAVVLSACDGGGSGQSNGAADSGIGDPFVAFVQRLSATAPETEEPVDVTNVAVSAPENAEPVD